ncbi:hypothetical protein GPALN_013302 [Globodera pallida]|nr:hypothetical protein GPALN_013302 [Globodera pallida]
MDKYTKKIAENIELIATHTAKWLNESLESAWPAIHQQILLEQIMRVVPSPGEAIHDDLEVVIQLSLPQLMATGTTNFVYQILIDAIPGGEQYFEGFEKYCFFQKEVYGFQTIINRMPINFTNELEKENVHAHMMDMADYASSFSTLYKKLWEKFTMHRNFQLLLMR